jgi:4-diphosphocytidyl-2-C-methyl-D-erythritol kinase
MSLRALFDLPAPAKLNLFLHVVGRRDDGYHLLQSVFALIDWADRLHLERRDDARLLRHDLGPLGHQLPDDDLCLRAARALQQASGCALGADISIDKQVPWGAGLGGGSSDAATVLLGLNRLWGLRWPRERLLRLAATLGADVPFFVGGDNAFVEGIGERLTPLALPRACYAVVKPAASLPTAAIFGSPLLKRDTQAVILTGSLADTATDVGGERFEASMCAAGFGRNDLEAAAVDRCHDVAQAAEWLRRRYGNSRMTGSGSAVFARVGSGDLPEATFPGDAGSVDGSVDDLVGLPPGWVGRLCRGLDRHPLAGWAG